MNDELVLIDKKELRAIVDDAIRGALAPKAIPFDPQLNIDDPIGLAQSLFKYREKLGRLQLAKYGELRTVIDFGVPKRSPSITEFNKDKNAMTANDVLMEEEQRAHIIERLEREVNEITELNYMIDAATEYAFREDNKSTQIFKYLVVDDHSVDETMEAFGINATGTLYYYVNRVWEDIAMHMFPDYFINAAIWPFISKKKPEANASKTKSKRK